MKKDKKVSEQREREREKQERKATARGTVISYMWQVHGRDKHWIITTQGSLGEGQ